MSDSPAPPSPDEPGLPEDQGPSRERWDSWFTTLGGEIYTMRMYRTFWRDFIKTAEDAHVTPGHIFDFFAATYSTRQAVAIRRLCGFRNRVLTAADYAAISATHLARSR